MGCRIWMVWGMRGCIRIPSFFSPLTLCQVSFFLESGFALGARPFLVAKKSRKKASPTNQPLRGALCCSTKRAHSQTRLKPQTWLSFIAFGLRCSAG